MPRLLRFTDSQATRLELSGGKGANLSILTQKGFPVPPGFIVTAPVYREFIRQGTDILRGVTDLPFHEAQRLREAAERLREKLAQFPLPPGIAEETRAALSFWPESQSFAVRSSSTMEDLASAAFAGQHETYLGCVGEAEILGAIKRCFLSLWQDRAIAYRQRQGFDHLEAAMAVVVQEMVECEQAGVGFSINPVNGSLDEMVVDANFGLGESVVSGEGEIDHWVLDKAKQTVREARIAHKSRMVVATGAGTREERVSEDIAQMPCLSAIEIGQLTGLLLQVEKSYQFPQDIEWGFAKGRLHLLQARPITAIPPRWTRDESAERFPNVLTPLTWDFVEGGFHRSLNHSFKLMGYPPFQGKWFGLHGHYVYGNQNAVELYGKRLPLAIHSLDELRAAIPVLRDNFRWVQDLPVLWMRDLDYYLMKIGEFLAAPLGGEDVKGLWAFIQGVNEHGANYFLPNIAISLTQGVLHRILHGLLCLVVGEAEAHRLFDGLMAYCEIKTGAINRELFEMAQLARSQRRLEQLIYSEPSQQIIQEKLLAAFPEFEARFGRFLRDHGHREVDFDAYHPTWVEVPWVVVDNLRLILRTPIDQTPAQKERELKVRQQQCEFEFFGKLPQDLHFFFHELLRLARAYTSLDDLEHYQTTRLTLPLRKGLRELGLRLQKRGLIEDPMDVFFARLEALDAAVLRDDRALWKEIGGGVAEEKAAYLQDKARIPEWVLGQAQSPPASGDCLEGIAGSPGQAEGPAFLVLTPEDFARCPRGAVLVARTTNPTWTPLFYSAVAVVTESGGPLSHGAVTAREMQIPAVMSVRGSLTRLRNGQKVRVDGTGGKVFLLPPA